MEVEDRERRSTALSIDVLRRKIKERKCVKKKMGFMVRTIYYIEISKGVLVVNGLK